MAALGFFRKHKRMVFWIMVVLMIVFALSIGGAGPFIRMFSPDPGDEVIGIAGADEITLGRLRQAAGDLELLGRLGLGDPVRVLSGWPNPVPGEMGLVLLMQEQNTQLCWVLLTMEAERMGIRAGRAAVDAFLAESLGMDPATLNGRVVRLAAEGVPEKRLRRVLDDYVCIAEAFEAVSGGLEETEPALRKLYGDMFDRMDVAAIRFNADDYLDGVQEPSEQEIRKLFMDAKGWLADDPNNRHPFKFGYRRPPRVQIEYVFVDWDDVLQSTQPEPEQMYRYWDEHKAEFTKPAATQPATQPTTGPTSVPAADEVRMVPITEYGEAIPLVREKLRDVAARGRMTEIVQRMVQLAGEFERDRPDAPGGPLALVADRMLTENVKVSFKRFAEPMDFKAISADEILSSARVAAQRQGQSLARLAFSVKELYPGARRRGAMVEMGKVFGQAMDVAGARRGKLIWRVVRAEPVTTPDSPEQVRRQVVADCKLRAAYRMAEAAAGEALAKAQQVGLAKTAEEATKEIVTAEGLSRLVLMIPARMDMQLMVIHNAVRQIVQWRESGRKGPAPAQWMPREAYAAAVRTPPFAIGPAAVRALDLQEATQAKQFLKAVFKMASAAAPTTAPAAVSATQPTSAPATADGIRVIGVPAQRAVLLVQRVKYQPAYEDDYRQTRAELLMVLGQIRRYQLAVTWYSQKGIQQRARFDRALP